MALSRVKTWSSGEVLTASDLNAEFNNILNNARDLITPLTNSLDMNGLELILDADADTSLTADTDDRLDLRMGGVDLFYFNGTATSPVNGLQFIAGATGTRAVIDAGITGADANVGLTLLASGTGPICIDNDTDPVDLRLLGAAGANNKITDVNGNELLILGATASAVNEVSITNAATTNPARIHASGETNVSLQIEPKGSGTILMTDGADTSKKVSWVLSGVSASTTRTITMVDANADLQYARAASDTVAGGIEIATQAEIETGTDTGRAVTPGRQHFHPSAAKAWAVANFAGALVTSYNTSSVTDTGTGQQTFNWTTSFSSANYAAVATNTSGQARFVRIEDAGRAAGTLLLTTNNTTPANADATETSVAAFGDL